MVDSVNGDWPRLDDLGINVTARLRRVIDHATQYDPDRRPKDVEAFKRELDRATPRVSLAAFDDGSLASLDGKWSIATRVDSDGLHAVDVKRDGRRRTILCASDLTGAAVRGHVTKVVKRLAEEPAESRLI
jgi:hypothetical protein